MSLVEQASFNPYYPVVHSGLDETLEIDGSRFIDLASNNYLGLANDERLKTACRAALDRYGASMCATPIASGYTELYHRLRVFMETYEFLVLPVNQVPPFDVEIPYPGEIAGIRMETYIDWMKSAYFVTVTGHPAISVPCG